MQTINTGCTNGNRPKACMQSNRTLQDPARAPRGGCGGRGGCGSATPLPLALAQHPPEELEEVEEASLSLSSSLELAAPQNLDACIAAGTTRHFSGAVLGARVGWPTRRWRRWRGWPPAAPLEISKRASHGAVAPCPAASPCESPGSSLPS